MTIRAIVCIGALVAFGGCGSARMPDAPPVSRQVRASSVEGPSTQAPARSDGLPERCRFGIATTRIADRPIAAGDPVAPAPEVAAAFPGFREVSDLTRLRRADGLEVVAATVWAGREDADIAFVSRRGEGPYGPVTRIDASPLLDGAPRLAWTGEGDRFAILWARGRYPFLGDLHLAIAEPAGRVVASRLVARAARPEGHALVRAGRHLVGVYTPSSAESRDRRGVFVVSTDLDGNVQRRTRVLAGDGLWPVAAATSDERAVGLVYRLERGGLGYAAISPEGVVTAGPRRVEQHEDPAASVRPSAMLHDDGLFWVGTTVGFHVSVIVAAPTEARVLALDPEGRAAASVRVSGATHAVLQRLASERGSANVSYVDATGAHEIRATCRPQAPTEEELRPGPCDATTEAWRRARFQPMRGQFRAAVVDGGWIVAHRPWISVDGYRRLDDEIHVARLRHDGILLWDVVVGEGELDGQVVANGERVGIPWQHGDRAMVSVLDVATGAERGQYRLERGGSRTSRACLAASADGWMIAFGHDAGPSQIVWMSDDGRLETRGELRDRWNGCALGATAEGFALVTTTNGRTSESNWIYAVGLDARGRPRGEPARIEGEGFARDPVVVREGRGALVVWTGPVLRELVAQRLDAEGRLVGAMTEVARTYGMSGFGIGTGASGPQLVWASERSGVGRRRVCAD